MNIKDFFLDGFAGIGSENLFNELERCLNYGTPKFLLWCAGMNDTYTTWSKYFEQLGNICKVKGITLVLQTIPWPTDGDKSDINNAIKASGYRYFDGYAAVSSDANGTWYTGYNADGTHTTEAGAVAMANRFLLDFPEILQLAK